MATTPTATLAPVTITSFTPVPKERTTEAPAKTKTSGWDLNSNGVCDPNEVLPPAPTDGTWSDASEHGCQYDFDLQNRPEVAEEYAQTQQEYYEYDPDATFPQSREDWESQGGTWNEAENRPKSSGEIQQEWLEENGLP